MSIFTNTDEMIFSVIVLPVLYFSFYLLKRMLYSIFYIISKGIYDGKNKKGEKE